MYLLFANHAVCPVQESGDRGGGGEGAGLGRRGPAARKKSVRGYAGNNSRALLRRRSSEDLYVKGEESFFSRQNRLNRLCDRGGRGPWGRGEYWDYLPMDCGSGRGKK